jgi:hypothetical protein
MRLALLLNFGTLRLGINYYLIFRCSPCVFSVAVVFHKYPVSESRKDFASRVTKKALLIESRQLRGNSHLEGLSFLLTGRKIGCILQLYERKKPNPL